jgi:hypothetical protein
MQVSNLLVCLILKDSVAKKAHIPREEFQLSLLCQGVDKCAVCILLVVIDAGLTSLTPRLIYRVTIAP